MTTLRTVPQADWIDWRQMHPLVRPAEIDAIDRAQIAAQQQPASHNRPIPRTT